jgi:hypothetical protein
LHLNYKNNYSITPLISSRQNLWQEFRGSHSIPQIKVKTDFPPRETIVLKRMYKLRLNKTSQITHK